MIKVFIDSIINLAFLSTIIFTSSFLISKIQSSIHYHRADIPPLLIIFIFILGSLLSSFLSGCLLLAKYYLTDIPSPPELSTWQTGNREHPNYAKNPQTRSLGLIVQSPPAWAKHLNSPRRWALFI